MIPDAAPIAAPPGSPSNEPMALPVPAPASSPPVETSESTIALREDGCLPVLTALITRRCDLPTREGLVEPNCCSFEFRRRAASNGRQEHVVELMVCKALSVLCVTEVPVAGSRSPKGSSRGHQAPKSLSCTTVCIYHRCRGLA